MRILESRQLGEIVSLESHFDRYRPQERRLPQAGSLPKPWHRQMDLGEGILWEIGPDLIDQSLRLFGVPQRVFGIILDQRRVSPDPHSGGVGGGWIFG